MGDAAKLCAENNRKAPWGCYWFQLWIDNVQKAHRLKQEILVFYFAGEVGKGKLQWHELRDKDAVDRAKAEGGLGNSQRAEVAWLERESIPFREVDVRNLADEIA